MNAIKYNEHKGQISLVKKDQNYNADNYILIMINNIPFFLVILSSK